MEIMQVRRQLWKVVDTSYHSDYKNPILRPLEDRPES
jgi:hypothetical protein